ncbi:hypothetical protein [Natronomonas marina]|jgi:hypothetical protein|uniref:hypothetical protein n=1 Tax=Natronomonas marina TaxID=2961939 RepID=UPI0020C9BBF0|nr:hypothetical protein [Natronomonas marina]
MACPYLRYRASDEEHEFDHERPYCAAMGRFVSPMRADVCNDRHDFSHETHCDVYRRAEERTAEAADAADAVGESVD